MDWSLLQIYNGYLKKILHGKYCQQSYTINTDKRRSLCGVSITGRESRINNRMSLAIVLKVP